MEFLGRIYRMMGLDCTRVMERRWFALKNFHCCFFEDAHVLNEYLHHWEGGVPLEDYYGQVWNALPWYLRLTGMLNRRCRPFRLLVQWITRMKLGRLALRKSGPLGWVRDNDDGRIRAFYGSMEALRNIPGWDEEIPPPHPDREYIRLEHGYDESKEQPDMSDLKQAAAFRGGSLVSREWDGDMFSPLEWRCCRDHTFAMTPNAVLKGGHWCVECLSRPAEYPAMAGQNPFMAQVVLPHREK